eukprot:TRINITY_DN1331_c0_g1_i1.p1 TRINITY_DN1331_c0_g1~~TRINITY_DN1331_c0_g1_i1.p1  ORF type:complete len:190 (+),score=39.30 TRINITY_DN1331_c0_g1_i1:193-762(+)
MEPKKRRSVSSKSHRRFDRWTKEESLKLLEAVKKFSTKNWKVIANEVGTKSRDSCYQHWRRVVNPELKKEKFSKDELIVLANAIREYGKHHWTKVSLMLPHRSDTNCRARWRMIEKGTSPFDAYLRQIAAGRQQSDAVELDSPTGSSSFSGTQSDRSESDSGKYSEEKSEWNPIPWQKPLIRWDRGPFD